MDASASSKTRADIMIEVEDTIMIDGPRAREEEAARGEDAVDDLPQGESSATGLVDNTLSNDPVTNVPVAKVSKDYNDDIPDINEPMYSINPIDNGYLLKELPRAGKRLAPTQRGFRCRYLPARFDMTRRLTPGELEDEGYHSLEDNKPVFVQAKAGSTAMNLLVAKLWGIQELKELGVSDMIARLQRLSLAPDFQPLLKKLAGPRPKKKGTKYNIAFTVEPTGKPNCTHPSRLAQHENPRVMEINSLISVLGQKIITNTPGAWSQAHDDAYHGEAWITCGDESNKFFSSIQMNFVPVGEQKARALGSRAAVHDDGHDERRCASVVFFLSYLPKNYFPGRFSMTNFRLTCTAASQTCLVIDANYPHGGSGDGPYPETLTPDSPLRYSPPAGYVYPELPEGTPYNRLYAIPYLRQECARVRNTWIGHETLEGGLGAFGTVANMMGFRMRHAIRDNHDIGIVDPTAEDWSRAFAYDAEGQVQYPAVEMAQKCLDYKQADHQDWKDLLKAAMYQTVHFINENVNEYGRARKRNAEEALRGDGPRFCTGINVSTNERCMAYVKKGVPNARFCRFHGTNGSFT